MGLLMALIWASTTTTTIKPVSAAFSCSDAVTALSPCGPFLITTGGVSAPTAECCRGAQSLEGMATTVQDRRALCECLKQTGPSFGVDPEKARQLPPLCKLSLNIPISPDVDCASIG
ncbi:hypothetical protein QJS10_CPA05g00961 [Acorus calamus]|uniref:Bifunctional inhibitor/plant lipid transfer protein/seed storage helical domain-containing protein n=1 Tax=Acorus calamus TaxID=4465 RepID=A0AAV9EXD7_ACOCL|nr:hypothetical protein QJS10_CPA05g00961 [Acorus calamus]